MPLPGTWQLFCPVANAVLPDAVFVLLDALTASAKAIVVPREGLLHIPPANNSTN